MGDVVRIQPDLDQAKVLNKRVGWKAEMDVVSVVLCLHMSGLVSLIVSLYCFCLLVSVYLFLCMY